MIRASSGPSELADLPVEARQIYRGLKDLLAAADLGAGLAAELVAGDVGDE